MGEESGNALNGRDLVQAKKKRNPRIERILRKKEPQVHENTRKLLTLRGVKSNETMKELLSDLSQLAKPHNVNLIRSNEIFPFEDANSIEFLTSKNDCSLFAFGSHSKKRSNNLILGRTYDGHLLDMFEFGIENYQGIQYFKGSHKAIGSKPLIVFNGDQWANDSTYSKLQLFLLDFLRGEKVDKIALKGLDHVISITVIDSSLQFRVYSVAYKRSGTKIPFTELSEVGPRFDMTMRRCNVPSQDMWKVACKKPKIDKPRKVKNVKDVSMGEKVGRLHIKKQDLDNMGTRQVSALRKRKGRDDEGGDAMGKKTKPRKVM